MDVLLEPYFHLVFFFFPNYEIWTSLMADVSYIFFYKIENIFFNKIETLFYLHIKNSYYQRSERNF